jgi:hypothetical protein
MSDQKKTVCGVIMPISAIDNCTEAHWSDVYEILTEAIEAAGFEANIVSNSDDSGIIHKRIIENLYDNPVVVCDVSGKNPNVMFELGMRLAFDKPTVIVKDDKTSYSFDTSGIEHLEYPRDLRFSRIVDFKKRLQEKITATHVRAASDTNYTTFLKQFGEFTVAKLDKKEISGQEYILEELKAIRTVMGRLETSSSGKDIASRNARLIRKNTYEFELASSSTEDMKNLSRKLANVPSVLGISFRSSKDKTYLSVETLSTVNLTELISIVGCEPEDIPF